MLGSISSSCVCIVNLIDNIIQIFYTKKHLHCTKSLYKLKDNIRILKDYKQFELKLVK